VNRELEQLRAILRFARNEGIIPASPFERASTPLISKADETKRTRILTDDEEARLLEACQKPTRAHLYPIVIAALDTGARKGELLALRWSDVSFERMAITLRAMTTKTLKTRTVPLSNRLAFALHQWAVSKCGYSGRTFPTTEDRVFPLVKFQNGWDAACEDAKIEDFRFHDLRACWISRMIRNGMPVELVAKISGHTQVSTLYSHYVRTIYDAIRHARSILNRDDDD